MQEHQRQAVRFGQCQERPPNLVVVELLQKVAVPLRTVRERISVPRVIVQREAIDLGEIAHEELPRPGTVPVDDEPAQDLSEPWPGPLGLAQGSERHEGPHVGLLDEILGILPATREADGKLVERGEMGKRDGLEAVPEVGIRAGSRVSNVVAGVTSFRRAHRYLRRRRSRASKFPCGLPGG